MVRKKEKKWIRKTVFKCGFESPEDDEFYTINEHGDIILNTINGHQRTIGCFGIRKERGWRYYVETHGVVKAKLQ